MTEYKRMVVYLYSYLDGKKDRNVGYARLEKRKNQIKLLIRINGLYSEKPYQVFLVSKKGEGYKKNQWGSFVRRGNVGEFRGTTLANNMLGREIDFSLTSGIIIEGIVEIAGFWKDIDINLEEIPEEKIENRKEKDDNEENNLKIMEVKERLKEDYIESKELEVEKESFEMLDINKEYVEGKEGLNKDKQTDDIDIIKGESTKIDNIVNSESEFLDKMKETSVEEVGIWNLETQEKRGGENTHNTVISAKNWWKNLAGKIVNVEKNTFLDGESVMIVKVKLEDIKYLPQNCWICRNNSFLLHNYYIFGFLIVLHNKNGEYYLGVPGIMDEREFAVANIFGFEMSKKISQEPQIRGYWLKLIDND